jgi:hypothetical protein
MALNRSSFLPMVREGVGRVSEEELSTDLLNSIVTRALRTFSEYSPRLATATLNPSSGRSIYSAADLDPNNLDIVAFFSDSLSNPSDVFNIIGLSAFDMSIGNVTNPDDNRDVDLIPRATDQFLRRVELEMLRRDSESKITYMGDQFMIQPSPEIGAAGVQLLVGAVHTDDTFPSRYTEELLLLTKALAAQDLIVLRRGKFSGVKVGNSTVNIDVKILQDMAKEWMDEFKQRARGIVIPAML